MANCLFKCVKWLVIIVIFVLIVHFWLLNKNYLIDEKELGALVLKHNVKKSADGDPAEAYTQIVKALTARYPGHILPEKDHQWVFINSGGWMGSFLILHCSLTEYIMLFGMGLDTMGHSGRYWANITDYVLSGEVKHWEEGSTKVKTYKAGDTMTTVWGEAGGVQFKAGTWMVEYGRGFIPSTLNTAVANIIFCTQDYYSLYYMLKLTAKTLFLEACTALGVGA